MSMDIQLVPPAVASPSAEAMDDVYPVQPEPDIGQIDYFAELLQQPHADSSLMPELTNKIVQDPAALLTLQSKTMMTFMRIELLAKTAGTAAQGINRLASIA